MDLKSENTTIHAYVDGCGLTTGRNSLSASIGWGAVICEKAKDAEPRVLCLSGNDASSATQATKSPHTVAEYNAVLAALKYIETHLLPHMSCDAIVIHTDQKGLCDTYQKVIHGDKIPDRGRECDRIAQQIFSTAKNMGNVSLVYERSPPKATHTGSYMEQAHYLATEAAYRARLDNQGHLALAGSGQRLTDAAAERLINQISHNVRGRVKHLHTQWRNGASLRKAATEFLEHRHEGSHVSFSKKLSEAIAFIDSDVGKHFLREMSPLTRRANTDEDPPIINFDVERNIGIADALTDFTAAIAYIRRTGDLPSNSSFRAALTCVNDPQQNPLLEAGRFFERLSHDAAEGIKELLNKKSLINPETFAQDMKDLEISRRHFNSMTRACRAINEEYQRVNGLAQLIEETADIGLVGLSVG